MITGGSMKKLVFLGSIFILLIGLIATSNACDSKGKAGQASINGTSCGVTCTTMKAKNTSIAKQDDKMLIQTTQAKMDDSKTSTQDNKNSTCCSQIKGNAVGKTSTTKIKDDVKTKVGKSLIVSKDKSDNKISLVVQEDQQ
jgi:hypothetical protein